MVRIKHDTGSIEQKYWFHKWFLPPSTLHSQLLMTLHYCKVEEKNCSLVLRGLQNLIQNCLPSLHLFQSVREPLNRVCHMCHLDGGRHAIFYYFCVLAARLSMFLHLFSPKCRAQTGVVLLYQV